MRMRLAAMLLALAVAGCGEGTNPTVVDPGSLGKEIVEALANIPSEPPYPGYPMEYLRGFRPINLSEIALVDTWNWGEFGEPSLAEALAKYVREGFPGTVMECNPDRDSGAGPSCFPLSPDDLPPEGVLFLSAPPVGANPFWAPPGNNRTSIGVAHYYVAASGQFDWHSYTLEMERVEAGWKVGEGGYICCS